MPDAKIAAFEKKQSDLVLALFGRAADIFDKIGALAGPGGESCPNVFVAACLSGRSGRRRWSGLGGS